MSEVLGLKHAHEAWTTLEASFSNRSKTRELQLKDELQLMQRGSKSVAEFSRLFKGLCDQLAAIGRPIDDLDKVHWFLRALGPDYKIFSTTMLSQSPLPSFADIILKGINRGKPKPPSASVTKSNLSPVYCQLCDKEVHLAKCCWTFLNLKKKQSANLVEAFTASSTPASTNSAWYPDSGATSHTTNDPEGVDIPTVYSGNERVMVANGQSLSISHTDSVSTLVPNSPLLLSNVLVVPGIIKKLISISQLTEDTNCWVIFFYYGFTIQDRVTKVMLGVGRCENGLYVLQQHHHALASIVSSNKLRVSAHLLHARLGHPSFCTIDSLTKSCFISYSDKLIGLDSSLCVGCNLGKTHRLPFSLNNTHCDLPFDRLHYDL